MAKQAATAQGPGLRERGKTDRLRRLHEAALEVFRARGYDAATTREIALAAGVSVGTVFVYAKDKRDLLFLVVNDDLDAVLQRALAAAREPAVLIDQLLALLAPIYGYFASEPGLARAMLLEVVHHSGLDAPSGDQALRYVRRMDAWTQAIAGLLDDAKQRGQLRLDGPPGLMARLLWDLHLVGVRRWMATDDPVAAAGQLDVRQLYTLVLGPRLRAGG